MIKIHTNKNFVYRSGSKWLWAPVKLILEFLWAISHHILRKIIYRLPKPEKNVLIQSSKCEFSFWLTHTNAHTHYNFIVETCNWHWWPAIWYLFIFTFLLAVKWVRSYNWRKEKANIFISHLLLKPHEYEVTKSMWF